MLKKTFVTGCDYKTEWQLPWFMNNFFEHSTSMLQIANFGMSMDMLTLLRAHPSYEKQFLIMEVDTLLQGWFKKPRAIYHATGCNFVTCWVDTDCQIVGDIDSIWQEYVPDIMGMVIDRPWTIRRPFNGDWHNSGVVLTNRNQTLENWMNECEINPVESDQHVLYHMYTPIEKISRINPLPHKYNTIRLDYIDNIAVKDPIIIHHTGQKGNETIREMISQ